MQDMEKSKGTIGKMGLIRKVFLEEEDLNPGFERR